MTAAMYITACSLVLVCASLAAADSAWVLWLGTGAGYTPLGAYGGATGEKDCKDAAAQAMAAMKGNTKELTDFLKSNSRYVCLPETVDPRAPRSTR